VPAAAAQLADRPAPKVRGEPSEGKAPDDDRIRQMVHKDINAVGPDAAELIVGALRTLRARYEQAVEQHGSAKARGCALEALAFAQLLIENLVGWAVEEVIRGEASDPTGPPRKGKHRRNAKPSERTSDRVLIAKMIAIGGIVPPAYRRELQLALKALNEGEVRPLLRPSLTGRWRDPFSLSEDWQLAILHVFYRWGSGGTKKAALEIVASALGVAPSTLRTWEVSALPEINDNAQAMWTIAKRAGAQAQDFEKDPSDSHADKAALVMHRHLLSNPLELVARRYKSLVGFGSG
jgi:hypothetical protein